MHSHKIIAKPEEIDMIKYFDWVRYNKLDDFIYHNMNEAKKSMAGGRFANRMGRLSGVSDIFIRQAKQGFHGFYIEMKSLGKNNRWGALSATQISFQESSRRDGYKSETAFGADEAIKITKHYLDL